MNEFIEKLIGRLEEESDFFCGEPMGTLQKAYYCKGVEKSIEIVKELAEEHKGGWIPCDENLPNHNQTVIFQTEDGMVETGYYDVNEDWCVNDSYFPNAFRFIAWQPLPEPYKE